VTVSDSTTPEPPVAHSPEAEPPEAEPPEAEPPEAEPPEADSGPGASGPPSSEPPPSRIPGKRASPLPWIAAALVAAVAAGGYWLNQKRNEELARARSRDRTIVLGAPPSSSARPPTSVAASASAVLPEWSPPAPPTQLPDAGALPSEGVAGPAVGGRTPPEGAGGACKKCGDGEVSEALRAAVMGSRNLARGCFNRQLRAGGAQGALTVAVAVGSDGRLCSATITRDTVSNAALSQCVLGRFRRGYPAPNRGCVVINVPINFKMQ
jgi:hypothetical protein